MAIFKKGIHANMLLDPIGPFTVLGGNPVHQMANQTGSGNHNLRDICQDLCRN